MTALNAVRLRMLSLAGSAGNKFMGGLVVCYPDPAVRLAADGCAAFGSIPLPPSSRRLVTAGERSHLPREQAGWSIKLP